MMEVLEIRQSVKGVGVVQTALAVHLHRCPQMMMYHLMHVPL
jgi:hypothetical protein